jgi:hypothetical protein
MVVRAWLLSALRRVGWLRILPPALLVSPVPPALLPRLPRRPGSSRCSASTHGPRGHAHEPSSNRGQADARRLRTHSDREPCADPNGHGRSNTDAHRRGQPSAGDAWADGEPSAADAHRRGQPSAGDAWADGEPSTADANRCCDSLAAHTGSRCAPHRTRSDAHEHRSTLAFRRRESASGQSDPNHERLAQRGAPASQQRAALGRIQQPA